MTRPDPVIEGADLVLRACGRLREGERVTIVCDETTRQVGEILAQRARLAGGLPDLVVIAPLRMHGEEPPSDAAERMRASDLCVGVTAKSMAHTAARIRAAAAGARYLSLPDYSLELLADASLRADYPARASLARRVADAFTAGDAIRVTSALGTDVTMSAAGRVGNAAPGFVERAGDLGSPPDIEANVSPLESSAEGEFVVDGSIPFPGVGLLSEPMRMRIRGGRIVDMDGPRDLVARVRAIFDSAGSDKACVLAECGVGLNDLASLSGTMLTDEGAAGTMHFGFGSNATVGGLNAVAFHLDAVFLRPTLAVDGRVILRDGELVI